MKWVEGGELVELLQQGHRKVMVLDVRDVDFHGHCVRGAVHIPFASERMDKVVESIRERVDSEELSDLLVVVHCFYSQQRGPTCARKLEQHLVQGASDLQERVTVAVLQGGWGDLWRRFGGTDGEYAPLFRPVTAEEEMGEEEDSEEEVTVP